MTLDELIQKITEILPGAGIDKDNYGQVIIYTSREVGENDELIPFDGYRHESWKPSEGSTQ